MTTKNTICLWYDHDAQEVANYYTPTFPYIAVGAIHRAPSDDAEGARQAHAFRRY